MALDSPYYFAIGSLVIEDGTDSGPYHPVGIWLPAPAPDGVGGHLPAVRRFRVKVTGTSTATLTANTAALQQACVRDETLYFRASGSGDILSCRIREASVVEDEVDLLGALSFERYVTLTITTDPYWLAPWGSWVGTDVFDFGSISIAPPGGEVPALLSLRLVAAAAKTGIYVGLMPNPATGYDHTDGAVTSTTLSAVEKTLTAASTVDARANAGRHLVLASGTFTNAGDASIRSRITTSGYNISSSVSVDQATPTEFTATTTKTTLDTGIVTLPSSAIPAGNEGDNYSVAHSLLMKNAGGGTWTGAVTRVPLDFGAVIARRAFSAGTGIYYDGDTDTVFLAGYGGGFGQPILSDATVYAPLRLDPGAATAMVFRATGTGAESLADAFRYRIRRRFLTATG